MELHISSHIHTELHIKVENKCAVTFADWRLWLILGIAAGAFFVVGATYNKWRRLDSNSLLVHRLFIEHKKAFSNIETVSANIVRAYVISPYNMKTM